ncbi:hypothetical protein E1287_16440 [Actinomadura sp. KC06]|uniref:hypothetical protein n=1 Tax=Actinomadura sp. KC06 TaxID=2530369 RepID=UPI0010443862|nr:hypothetical protein [Actinomadura sp. KC06]TDD34481.1 hypothetical protein E1287_16440 [Actinomadura sp. KC06]
MIDWKKEAFVASTVRSLGLGIAVSVAMLPLIAAAPAEAAPNSDAAAARCGYDICMYTKKNYKGTMKGYNHWQMECTNFDRKFKMKSLKITSNKGTTFYAKKGCKGRASKSFRGNVNIPNYAFTARSGY